MDSKTAAIPPFTFKTFEYEPLPPGNFIRLLEIDRKAIADPSICGLPLLSCSLKTVDLDQHPPYNTLSYTWGNPMNDDPSSYTSGSHHVCGSICQKQYASWSFSPDSNRRPDNDESPLSRLISRERDSRFAKEYKTDNKWPISCDNKILYITKNLYEALLQLRMERAGAPEEGDEERDALYDKTALIWAGERGQLDTVKELLLNGANVLSQDRFGETALHYASENGHLEVVRLLVQAGSNTRLLDRSRRTPLDCARKRNHANVVSFLENHLQEPAKAKYSCSPNDFKPLLWVDAICINQEDTLERNAQINIMWNVYTSAKRNIIWLGRQDDDTEIARTIISQLAAVPGDYPDSLDLDRLDDVEFFKKLGVRFSTERWGCFLRFLHRAWFSRTWIIQEVVLAKQNVVLCGSLEFSWDELIKVFTMLSRFTFSYTPKGIERRLINKVNKERGSAISGSLALIANLQMSLQNGKAQCLEAALFLTRRTLVTDPRDKIYALLSLCCQSPLFGGVCHSRKITPDYSQSVTQVFTDATRAMLNNHKEMRILSIAGLRSDRTISTLPSWVPDYTMTSNGIPFSHLSFGLLTRYNACDNPDALFRATGHERYLGLTGARWDTVQGISETGMKVIDSLSFGFICWIDLVNNLPKIYHNGQNRAEVLWRTLCADHEGNQCPAPSALKHSFRLAMLFWILKGIAGTVQRNLPKKDIPSTGLDTFASIKMVSLLAAKANHSIHLDDEWKEYWTWPMDLLEGGRHASEEIYERAMRFFEAMRNHRYTRLFRTSNNYLGIGPTPLQDGDGIWIIAGANIPFVLRKTEGGRYLFVGEAYVHGIMHRETLKLDKLKFEEIELE